MMIACAHADHRTNGKDRHGNTRFRCKLCGKTWVEVKPVKPLGDMRVPVDDAKLALRLLVEGNSVRGHGADYRPGQENLAQADRALSAMPASGSWTSGCAGLTLTHLQFDEQWT